MDAMIKVLQLLELIAKVSYLEDEYQLK